MRLTSEQYRHGFIRWQTAHSSTVQTSTASDASYLPSYSEPLTNASGSIVSSAPLPHRDVKLNADAADVFDAPWWIVWDRLDEGDLHTLVIDSAQGAGQVVMGMLNLGHFRHVIVAVPYLDWREDLVFRTADVLVRLVKHESLLPPGQAPPLARLNMPGPTNPTYVQSQPERFIEILTPESEGGEGDLAFSILGLLALLLGDAAVGDVVMSDTRAYDPASGGTEYRVILGGRGAYFPSSVSLTMRLPIHPSDAQMDRFDQWLVLLVRDEPVSAKIGLGLRWNERGLRAFSPTDSLLASYVGVETVVTAISTAQGFLSPIADLVRDSRIPMLLAPLIEPHGAEKVDRLVRRLTNPQPSMLDRFDRVAQLLDLPVEVRTDFRSMHDQRNRVMHGSGQPIDQDAAEKALNVLARVLQATFSWQLDQLERR